MGKPILIYGSYGYTGNLVARFAAERGMNCILSGRNEEKLKAQSSACGLPYRVADLHHPGALREALRGCSSVIHCAGPFVHTAHLMAEACIDEEVHYMDITGEIQVFESLKKWGKAAKEKNLMILPGTGFDVVPSDCMSLYLKNKLPGADHLELAIMSKGGAISHGTATTVVQNLGMGGAIREGGKIVKVPNAYATRKIDFGFGTYSGMTIPWGDISTAYTSTGIPNIMVYNVLPSNVIRMMKWSNYFSSIVGSSIVKNFLQKKVDSRPPGPNDEQRSKAKSFVWGEVRNGSERKSAVMSMPEGYTLTALTSLLIAEKINQGNFQPGYQTPAKAYGEDLIMEIEGVKREDSIS